jgi:hypothetical protein
VAHESDLGVEAGSGADWRSYPAMVGRRSKEIDVERVAGRWLGEVAGVRPVIGVASIELGMAGGASQQEVPVADKEDDDELALGCFFTT